MHKLEQKYYKEKWQFIEKKIYFSLKLLDNQKYFLLYPIKHMFIVYLAHVHFWYNI